MSVQSIERIIDLGIKDLHRPEYSILHYGLPEKKIVIAQDSAQYEKYRQAGMILRLYFGLMGEISPQISPLSVDVAGDKDYHVYRYDWVFGVSLPNVIGPDPGKFWWDWQKALSTGTSVAVQLVILPGISGIGYTCVATNLNVLPPSRDTQTWWQKNRSGVLQTVKSSAQVAENLYPGMITKTVSALSNSLQTQDKWKRTNWFIYQFLDSDSQACAVEWLINKKVLKQYGALLRGSLVLAFHGDPDKPVKEQRNFRLMLRPQLGFNRNDELARVSAAQMLQEADQVYLEVLPIRAPA